MTKTKLAEIEKHQQLRFKIEELEKKYVTLLEKIGHMHTKLVELNTRMNCGELPHHIIIERK